jgi:hypothetical protein
MFEAIFVRPIAGELWLGCGQLGGFPACRFGRHGIVVRIVDEAAPGAAIDSVIQPGEIDAIASPSR